MVALRSASQSLLAALLPLLLWMGVIFFFSSLPGSGTDVEPSLGYVLERKGAHVFEYAVLMLLAFRFVRTVFPVERFSRQVALAGAFSIAYAATDELHQLFVFGRGGRMTDVMIDGIGILVMTCVLIFLKRWSKKISNT